MTRVFARSAWAVLLLLSAALPVAAWGDKGHRISAGLALRSLPAEPASWFEGREAQFREHIVAPDLWKRSDRKEGPRHYLDCEPYGGPEGVPHDLEAALHKVGAGSFGKLGSLPWIVQDRYRALVQAFRKGHPEGVVEAAGYLGHYIGDVQVPLHSTLNHDGQLTDQRGVHARWESSLVELFVEEADLTPRPAQIISDLAECPFAWLGEAFVLVEQVLADDRAAFGAGPEGKPRRAEARRLAWELQGSTLKQQLQRSGERLGDAILTAWVEAGRPSLVRTAAGSATP